MSMFISNLSDSSKTALLKKIAERNPKALTDAFNSLAEISETANNIHSGLLSARQVEELDRLIKGNEKINAIKLHRIISGDGLRESKDWVEERARIIGYPFPNRNEW